MPINIVYVITYVFIDINMYTYIDACAESFPYPQYMFIIPFESYIKTYMHTYVFLYTYTCLYIYTHTTSFKRCQKIRQYGPEYDALRNIRHFYISDNIKMSCKSGSDLLSPPAGRSHRAHETHIYQPPEGQILPVIPPILVVYIYIDI